MRPSADVFSQLAERVCRGKVYARYVKILENQLTTEEAQILVGVADKKSVAELAAILKMEETALAARIEDLKSRRYIVSRQGVINIIRNPLGFPRGTYNMKTRQLWTEFFRSGDLQKIIVEAFKVGLELTGVPSWRVIP